LEEYLSPKSIIIFTKYQYYTIIFIYFRFVELGAYNIPDADTMDSRIPVSKAVVHRFASKSPIQNDIGLLKLSYSVVFSGKLGN